MVDGITTNGIQTREDTINSFRRGEPKDGCRAVRNVGDIHFCVLSVTPIYQENGNGREIIGYEKSKCPYARKVVRINSSPFYGCTLNHELPET